MSKKGRCHGAAALDLVPGPGPADLPTFAVLDEIDVHTHNALARSFLGSAHAPFVMQPPSLTATTWSATGWPVRRR